MSVNIAELLGKLTFRPARVDERQQPADSCYHDLRGLSINKLVY